MKILIKSCHLYDDGEPRGYRSGQSILIENQRISLIQPEVPDESFDDIIDGSRRLAIPGLINAHSHSPENLGRASHDRLPLEPWLFQMIFGLGEFSPEDHYAAALLGALETIKSGGTAILDHLTLPGGFRKEVFDAVLKAYEDIGIRARVAPLLRDPSEEVMATEIARRFAPRVFGVEDAALPDPEEMFSLVVETIERWHGQARGRLRLHMGPGGIQWATIPFLRRCQETARRFEGVGVHTHLMETRVQDQTIRAMHGGKTAVAMMEAEGLLGPDWSLAHSIWLTPKDIERIAAAGAVPVHNPAANMRLGSGFAPIRRMFEAGIVPGLGADGSMSGDHQNLFGILHLAAQIHNCTDIEADRWIGAGEVMRMATEGGARALMQENELGKLQPGALADITLLDLDDISLTPFNHATHHLAYTLPSSAVHTVIVDGVPVLRERRLTTMEESDILREARERAARLPLQKAWPHDVRQEVSRLLKARDDLHRQTKFEMD